MRQQQHFLCLGCVPLQNRASCKIPEFAPTGKTTAADSAATASKHGQNILQSAHPASNDANISGHSELLQTPCLLRHNSIQPRTVGGTGTPLAAIASSHHLVIPAWRQQGSH